MRVQDLIPLSIRQSLGNAWSKRQHDLARQRLLSELAGDRVECNVCGWLGAGFTDDPWHSGTVCPVCGSQVRHRMLAAAFDGRSSLSGIEAATLLKDRALLHFAPERQLRERLQKTCRRYVTADFGRGDCDLQLDISAMPTVADASFDTVIACDVLEHVPDDASAFREIYRILRPAGFAVLTVPQKDPPASTDEDASVIDSEAREKRFGQKDHVRMYGDEFVGRMSAAGFAVQVLDRSQFTQADIERHVLVPPAPNPNPLATNQRRLYFGRK